MKTSSTFDRVLKDSTNAWLEVSICGEAWTAIRQYKGQPMPTLTIPESRVGDGDSDGTLAPLGLRVRKHKATVEASESREALLRCFHLYLSKSTRYALHL